MSHMCDTKRTHSIDAHLVRVFRQTNLEKNANKYYVIQLVENEDSEYFVFTRWGRFSLV